MLVLSRKPQQQIQIGNNITISILKVGGNTVRIGVEAPRDIHIRRGELPLVDLPAHQPQQAEQVTHTLVPTVPVMAAGQPLTHNRVNSPSIALGERIQRRMTARGHAMTPTSVVKG